MPQGFYRNGKFVFDFKASSNCSCAWSDCMWVCHVLCVCARWAIRRVHLTLCACAYAHRLHLHNDSMPTLSVSLFVVEAHCYLEFTWIDWFLAFKHTHNRKQSITGPFNLKGLCQVYVFLCSWPRRSDWTPVTDCFVLQLGLKAY